METEIQKSDTATTEILNPDKLFHEINLLRIEGYYFCFDPKLAKKNLERDTFLEQIKTPEGFVENPIIIEPHPTYGKPTVLAYKILDTIIKKHSDYYFPLPKGVPFSYRELAKLVGRSSFGGSDQKDFYNAVMQLKRTGIICSFYNKENKTWCSVDFTIFDTVLFSGKKEKINQCFFSLHPIIIESLNSRYSFCLNYTRMKKLEPIGSALFKHLFFHFSNIYSKKTELTFTFKKDYKSICDTWLGGLKSEKQKSKILQQFGNHFKKLKETDLIKKFEIEKNIKGDGFNLIFYPGKGFFEDYKDFYCSSGQLKIDFKKVSDENQIKKPMELVSYFYEKLFKTDEIKPEILQESDINFAKSLLEKMSFEGIKSLIDYSIDQAQKTGFDMKKFGGIKNYQTEFFIKQKEIEGQKSQKLKEQKIQQDLKSLEKLKEKYEEYKEQKIKEYINELGFEKYQEELNQIGDRISQENPGNPAYEKRESFMYKRTVEAHFFNEIIKQDKVKILTFEDWEDKF